MKKQLSGWFYKPAKAGPIKRSSCVLKPFSPVPTKNMIEPREIVPKPKIKFSIIMLLNKKVIDLEWIRKLRC